MRHIYTDWFCGIKSGIPICCVVFYNLIWKWLWILPDRYVELYIKPKRYNNLGLKVQYIKCPMCIILKRKTDIKNCNWIACQHHTDRCNNETNKVSQGNECR